MIARLTVNPASLSELGGADGTTADVFAQHSHFCDTLRTYGVLVVGSASEERALGAAIVEVERRSREAGQIWREIFKLFANSGRARLRQPPCDRCLQEVETLDVLRAEWQPHTDVLVLTSAQAERVGVDASEVSHIDSSGLDLVPAGRAVHAQTLRRLRDLRDDGFLPRGTPRQWFWEQVLRPIAAESREITIYDRYLYGRLAQRRRDAPSSDSTEPEHVIWLLEQLDTLDPSMALHVKLMGSFNGRPNPGEEGRAPTSGQDAGALVGTYWTPTGGGIKELNVIAANFASSLPHARHLRSNLGVGITMEAGWDRFARDTITDRDGVEWMYRWKPGPITKFQQAEQRVMNDASVRTTRIRPA
jgi:hypothetical protein